MSSVQPVGELAPVEQEGSNAIMAAPDEGGASQNWRCQKLELRGKRTTATISASH